MTSFLTPAERRTLRYLQRMPGKLVDYCTMREIMPPWDHRDRGSNTLAVRIHNLRRKLPANMQIVCERFKGYKLVINS